VHPVTRLYGITDTGRGATDRRRRLFRVGGTRGTRARAVVRRVADAAGGAADGGGRHERVRRAGGARAGAVLRRVADAGGRAAHRPPRHEGAARAAAVAGRPVARAVVARLAAEIRIQRAIAAGGGVEREVRVRPVGGEAAVAGEGILPVHCGRAEI